MNKIRTILAPLFAGALLVLFPAGAGASASATPPRIVLVGDSTVAPNGGWGAAFCRFLGDGVSCTNLARAGRSSKSYLAEGLWEKALAARGDYYLIQFGHNDQPGKGPDRETDPTTTYTANMARLVDEARAIGATPVLITSLTRRNFSKVDPARIDDSLAPYVEAVKKLAAEKNVPLIDLHARSLALCEKLGPAGTAPFNRAGKDGSPDTTHLSDAGGMAFARLVVQDLRRVVPALAPVLLAEPLAPAASPRYRAIISTDIGGSDPDDHQSLVHLLVYANSLDIEGLISTQSRGSRKAEILKLIGLYEQDYPNLKTYSDKYPTPDALRAVTKTGVTNHIGASGIGKPTEGSEWIIQCARRDDPRPLYVLVWGGITDLAQALHDAPDILPKLRVYFIGGPNKQGSVNAYNYIERNHPNLWMIENNATYRGWFVGGNQTGEWANTAFVAAHIAGHGALGDFFAPLLNGRLKMGDTPSLAWLLHGVPEDPLQPGWGGKFVRVWDGRNTIFNHLPTRETEPVEVFGVNEIALPVPEGYSATNTATLVLDTQDSIAGVNEGKVLRFRFAVRDAKTFSYTIKSDFAGLNGLAGRFTAGRPPIERTSKPSTAHPNWWSDDPDPATAEGAHPGAKSINQWRVDFLSDFGARMKRCKTPEDKGPSHPPQNRLNHNTTSP
jgi:lysophospholipase L1-like esterase